MSTPPRSVTILGSTGSIGCSTIALIKEQPALYHVRALVGGRNVALLAEQARELRAECAVIHDEALLGALKSALKGTETTCMAGRQAVIEAASIPADYTMAAITGAAGLEPTLAATANGRDIALANKEALVSAGDVMLRVVKKAGATLLPVDSEHNAIFQCLQGNDAQDVEKIILTASGGPFIRANLEEMRRATPEKALKHPTWTMGAKITIDSATMANKGLEVIEAARLFQLEDARIDVLVHPQSAVHGLVQYRDGSLIAHVGANDMRVPIAHTLGGHQRLATKAPRLDLAELATLSFEKPDETRFKALRLARQALRAGHGAPTIYSAANEVAVESFLQRRIGFLDIAEVIEHTLEKLGAPAIESLDAVLHWDAEARKRAQSCISKRDRPVIRRADVSPHI